MATPSIQYITQLLEEPYAVSETDAENIDSLTQAFPYFLPVRYVNAALSHKKRPFNAPMMTNMQLYMGNWLLFSEFLYESLKRSGDKERIAPKLSIKKPEVVERFPLYDEEFMPPQDTFPDDKAHRNYIPKELIQETPPVSVHVHYATPETIEHIPTEHSAQNIDINYTIPGSEEETETLQEAQDITVPDVFEEAQIHEHFDVVEDKYAVADNEMEMPLREELPTQVESMVDQQEEVPAEYETPAKDEDEEPYDNTRYIIEQISIPGTVKETQKDKEDTTKGINTATEEETISIEEELIYPVYTDDYFKQQGIEVSNEMPEKIEDSGHSDENPQSAADDAKSLMVVRGFSEWLSHFKKTNEKEKEEREDKKALKTMWQKERLAAAIEEGNDEIPEKVFEMAVNSIAKEENLASEALAEIYEKQGKYDTAIDMYRKLSLRNPQKNAYFARKIEALLKK